MIINADYIEYFVVIVNVLVLRCIQSNPLLRYVVYNRVHNFSCRDKT